MMITVLALQELSDSLQDNIQDGKLSTDAVSCISSLQTNHQSLWAFSCHQGRFLSCLQLRYQGLATKSDNFLEGNTPSQLLAILVKTSYAQS